MTKYNIIITNAFKKDIKRAKKQGKNIDLLFEIIDKLSEGEILDSKYKDHALKGQYKDKENAISNPTFF